MEVLRDGRLPATTTWSYAVSGHPWINHENIAELVTAWSVHCLGVYGLTIGKALLAAVILGALLWRGRQVPCSWFALGLVAILAADNMRFHWQFRPHVGTYTCFALMLAVLDDCFAGWRGAWRGWKVALTGAPVEPPRVDLRRLRRLWILPPLFCFWTNTHGGFAAGLAVALAYLGLRAAQGWLWWGKAASGLLQRLAMMALACVLATFLNPYGPRLHLWMADTLGAAPPEIGDWAPLPIWSQQATGFWLLIGVCGFAICKTSRRYDPVQGVLAALVLWQGLAHCRHICFFAIMCGFWIPPHLDAALAPLVARWRLLMSGRPPAHWTRPALTGVLIVWLAAIAAQLGPKLSTIPVERKEYPVSAMQFLKDRGLQGRVMVTFNWAQYAIACFARDDAGSRVAIDGRLNTCYPRDVLDVYLDFLLGEPVPGARLRAPDSPAYDPALALDYERPDLFLLDRGQRPAIRTISADPRWILLYQDSLAQLWGRKDRFGVPGRPDFLPPDRRTISDEPQSGSLSWPAFPVAAQAAILAAR